MKCILLDFCEVLLKAYACVKHGSICIKIKFLWDLSAYMVS